jgi:endonuclease YncB( thermonuclease family)
MKLSSQKALISVAVMLVVTLVIPVARVASFVSGEGYIAKVFDGDSVLLADGREVRYIGVDTPEVGGYRTEEYWGDEASRANRTLVEGKKVMLEFDKELKDSYGRTLAYVFAGDVFVNLALVREGAALALPYWPNLKYHRELRAAMDEARREKRGMWAHPDRWIVDSADALGFIGQSKTVVGRVLFAEAARPGVFLNFGRDFSTDFTVFIPKQYLVYFSDSGISDPAASYRGRTIEVTGTIDVKNGPSITVRHPDQIYVRPQPYGRADSEGTADSGIVSPRR